MEGPQKFTSEGLEGVRQAPRDESLERGDKIERAERSVAGMFNTEMEASGVIKRVTEGNRSSFSGLEERSF